MNIAEHPTVRRFRENQDAASTVTQAPIDAASLRQLCLDCGADDAGLVEISRPALDDQRDEILRYFPHARTLLSFVCRMNREPSAARPAPLRTWNSTAATTIRTKSLARSSPL